MPSRKKLLVTAPGTSHGESLTPGPAPSKRKDVDAGTARSAVRTSRPREGSSPTSHGKAHPTCLAFESVVNSISAVLVGIGARKVEAAIPDRPVGLAVEKDQMDEAFAILGNAIARGAVVTIVGDLVRMETGETDGDRGCALLSVSVTGGQASSKTVVRDALSAVREIIKKQRGFLRFWEERGGRRLILYLPVVHGA